MRRMNDRSRAVSFLGILRIPDHTRQCTWKEKVVTWKENSMGKVMRTVGYKKLISPDFLKFTSLPHDLVIHSGFCLSSFSIL